MLLFHTTVIITNDSYTFQVIHKPVSRVLEHFHVVRGGSEWIFQSNRPLLHREGLKHKRPEVKWLSGESWNRIWRERVADEIFNKIFQ